MWAHLTGARAGSASLLEEIAREESSALWTTPCADDTAMRSAKYAQGRTPLSMQAGSWPTPVKADGERGSDWDARREGNPTLVGAARHWPTPTAGDARASGSRNTPSSAAHAGVSLSDAVTTGNSLGRQGRATPKDGENGSPRAVLSPFFVEALQGYPVGWTDCAVLETPSFQRKRRPRSASSPTG